MAAPHLLILDEPTNHLDIDSRRALLEALNDYEGAVILITHDRSLMELVADRLWLAADGTIKPFDGDMDDYASFVLDRARRDPRTGAALDAGYWRSRRPAQRSPQAATEGLGWLGLVSLTRESRRTYAPPFSVYRPSFSRLSRPCS